MYRNFGIKRIACVAQRLRNGKVGIVQLNIFAHKRNIRILLPFMYAVYHFAPFVKLCRRSVYAQFAAHNGGKVRFFKQRRFVKAGQRDVFYYTVRLNVAEKGYLFEYGIFKRFVAAQHYYVRVYAHALQLLYGVLSGL